MTKAEEQIGVVLKTALPPVEGVLFEGQICNAYATALGELGILGRTSRPRPH